MMTKQQVLRLLQREIDKRKSLRQWSRENACQPATVSRILNGKLPIQNKVLIALRLVEVVRYARRKR